MMKWVRLIMPGFLLLGFIGCATQKSMTPVHPEKVTGMPVCTECHTDSYGKFSHQDGFYGRHRILASQSRVVCSTCHQESFCADCHTRRDELLPSDKYRESPERNLPHRGEYLFQHRIDGKINPVSCARCHGRMNNERCATCHR